MYSNDLKSWLTALQHFIIELQKWCNSIEINKTKMDAQTRIWMTESDFFSFNFFFLRIKPRRVYTTSETHSNTHEHTHIHMQLRVVTATTFEQTNIETNGLNWIGLKVDWSRWDKQKMRKTVSDIEISR